MNDDLTTIDVPALRWEQPKWARRIHHLKSGEMTYATLEWPLALRSMGSSSSREGRYTFKRGGFLHPYVTVRRQEFETDLARINLDWKGNGDLVFTNGLRYTYSRSGLTHYNYEVTDHRGLALFHLKKDWSAFKHGGEVTIYPAGLGHRDIALLITLCWYLVVMAAEDAAAAGAAGGAGGG